jgi:hypothetical protein
MIRARSLFCTSSLSAARITAFVTIAESDGRESVRAARRMPLSWFLGRE